MVELDARGRAILAAAARLARATGSLEAVPIGRIAAEAGLARATLYRRFPTKLALAEALAGAGVAEANGGDDRRRQILDAAARAFPRSGFRGTTMEQIAAEAGIRPATIYWYFPSKEALIGAMLGEFAPIDVAEHLAVAPPDVPPDVALREAAHQIIARVQPRIELLRLVIGEAASYPELAPTVFQQVTMPVWRGIGAYLEAEVARGRFRPGNTLARVFCFGGPILIAMIAASVLGERMPIAADDIVDELVDVILRGVARAAPDWEAPA